MTFALRIFIEALKNEHVPYAFLDSNRSFMQLLFPGKKRFVIHNTLGLISDCDAKIALDKAYQYDLLKNDVPMPRTKSYIDPDSIYGDAAVFRTQKDIIRDICETFTIPFIIKRNKGSFGTNVFLVTNKAEVGQKVRIIFNQRNKNYDYILLAQDYITPQHEYRVIMYESKIYITYLKDITGATVYDNISPLHWENAHTIDVVETDFIKFEPLIRALQNTWPLRYAGFDIIEDKTGKMWLIEVNSAPSSTRYILDNGRDKLLGMFRDIIRDMKKQNNYPT